MVSPLTAGGAPPLTHRVELNRIALPAVVKVGSVEPVRLEIRPEVRPMVVKDNSGWVLSLI